MKNPQDWWDHTFWDAHLPSRHFDTPGTLCALPLGGIFLAWIRNFELTGVLEIGCGDGRILTECQFRNPDLPCTGVDVRHPFGPRSWQAVTARWDVSREEWRGAEFLDSRPRLVVAVEWLDDLPAVVAEERNAPVAVGPDGRTAELSARDRAWLERWWPLAPGTRAVVGRSRDRAWQWLAERLAPGSVLATIDYGHTADSRPPDGGLTAHLAGQRVTPGPGVNVTAGVAVDSLAAAVESVGAERLWCERLADLPAGFWGAEGTGLAGLALRSQEALLRDPDRFGGFWLVAHRIGAGNRP